MEYRYEARDSDGRAVQGTLEAPDEGEAAAALRARGLFPTALLPQVPAAASAERVWGGWVKSSDVSLFLSQLALMLRSGLTLLYALETMAREANKPGLRACAGRLGTAVQAGRPLSEAMAEERLIPGVVPNLVRTAEATGELDTAFDRAAVFVERRAALRVQLVSSLAYPAVVVVAAAGVFWFLTTRVVPKFASFLAQRGVALPWTTQALMDVSGFLTAHGTAVLLGVAASAAGLAIASTRPRGRRALERCVFWIPVAGALLQAAAMAQLARTLALLLRSGLPLLEALESLKGSVTFATYQDVIERARARVIQGATLAKSLEDPLVPRLGLQVVTVGEETGALEQVVTELANHYEQRVQQLVRILSSLIEPVLLVVIGGMVGFVYFSFFQAVFRLAGA